MAAFAATVASLPQRSSVVAPRQSLPAQAVRRRSPVSTGSSSAAGRSCAASRLGIAGSQSLATGGTLGGSQAGARLIYNFNRQLADDRSAPARRSADAAARSRPACASTPCVDIPIWLTAERRQAIGQYGGGRSAFAAVRSKAASTSSRLAVELQPQRLCSRAAWSASSSRDLFADGGLHRHPPGLRADSRPASASGAGRSPAFIASMPARALRCGAHERQGPSRLAPAASPAMPRPGSGPAVTLAGDF